MKEIAPAIIQNTTRENFKEMQGLAKTILEVFDGATYAVADKNQRPFNVDPIPVGAYHNWEGEWVKHNPFDNNELMQNQFIYLEKELSRQRGRLDLRYSYEKDAT